jgi:WD40 repeat protein
VTALTGPGLLDLLCQCSLIDPTQLDEVRRTLLSGFPTGRLLAGELLRRGWLTAYQVNQLLAGRGRELVLGPYVLLERLGQGGMGQVFKARHRRLDRLAALKVIRPDLLEQPGAVQRFQREARAAARLTHPHIVTIYDADEVGGTHFLAMEYVAGTDLQRLVGAGGPLPVDRACDCVRQAALGLQHMHDCGLVHRDVKPANLLLSADGTLVKVLDMGLARLAAVGGGAGASLTEPGVAMGTPDYLAPEQARDCHTVDIRADLYSLGCTLYFLLTGQPPFLGGSALEKLFQHQWQEPVPVEQRRPGVSPAVAAVVRKLMAKRPQDRYPIPAEAAVALAALTGGGAGGPLDLPTTADHVGPDQQGVQGMATALTGTDRSCPGRTAAAPDRPAEPQAVRTPPAPPMPAPSAAPRATARKPRRWWPAGVSGGVLVGGLLLWALFRAGESGDDVKGQAEAGKQPALLDRLNPRDIPPRERLDGQPGELVATLGSHRWRNWGDVRFLSYQAGGRELVSGGSDACQVWLTNSGRQRTVFPLAPPIYGVALAPDGRTMVTREGQLWDLAAGKARAQLEMPNGVLSVAYSPDSRWTALGYKDAAGKNIIKVLDVPRGAVHATFLEHRGDVVSLAFASGGKILASGSADGTVKLWDLSRKKARFTKSTGSGTAVAFAPGGKTLAAAGALGVIWRWDVSDGKEQGPPLRQASAVWALTYSPDGKTLAAAGYQLKLWDLDRNQVRAECVGFLQRIYAVAYAPDGHSLAGGGDDSLIRFWDAVTGKEIAPRTGHRAQVSCVAFAPDGRTLATGSWDATAKWWDPLSGQELATFSGHRGMVHCLAIVPGGRLLATGSQDGTVRLWDLATHKEAATLRGHTDGVFTLAVAPTGKFLASGSEDHLVRLWDLTAPGSGRRLPGHRARISAVAFDPAGKTLLSASRDGVVKLWDVARGKERSPTPGTGRAAVLAAAFAPDGRTLALGYGDGTVALWSPGSGRPPVYLPGQHPGQVCLVAFAADATTLTSASHPGDLIRWDLKLRKVCYHRTLPAPILGSACAADGRHLATANASGTVSILRFAAPAHP